jgi:hypothetical protein
MNYARLIMSAVAATIVYYVVGSLIGALFAGYYSEYATVFRPRAMIVGYIPIGFAGTLVAMAALTAIFALGYRGRYTIAEGARFGLLVGVFVLCSYIVHDYVILNIGPDLALAQAAAELPSWTLTGVVIGWLYRPRVSGSTKT